MRKIRKSKWYKNEGVSWLAEGELQADALGDLNTKNNELSVWCIEDDESNLKEVVTALAAKCDDISNLDYALFDQQLLSEISIRIKATKGGSPYERANDSWHHDLVELSAFKLMELANTILNSAKKGRVPEKAILQQISQAVASGQIERTKLKPRIVEKIDKLIATEESSP